MRIIFMLGTLFVAAACNSSTTTAGKPGAVKSSKSKLGAVQQGTGQGTFKLALDDLKPKGSFSSDTVELANDEIIKGFMKVNGGDESASDDPCSATEDQLTAQVVNNRLVLDGKVDLSSCTDTSDLEGSGYKLSKYEISIYLSLTCEGWDLNKLKGLPFSKLPECNKSGTILQNSKVVTQYESENSVTSEREAPASLTGDTFQSTSIATTSNSQNEACSINLSAGKWTNDGCVSIYSDTSDEKDTYRKFVHENVQWSDSNKNGWYESGSLAVTFNNFSGKIAFKSAVGSPSYSFVSGQKSLSGTAPIQALAGDISNRTISEFALRLKGSKLKLPMLKWKESLNR